MPAEPAAYRPVIVIPVYNHPATVEDVVRRLLSTGTPVLLVDDASDPPAQEACERCRAMGAGLVRRQSTGGRGASILTGFKAARQAGFTHALVFDAGGRQGQGHVAYAELYESLIRVLCRIGSGAAGDFSEKIAAGEFSVVLVEFYHLLAPHRRSSPSKTVTAGPVM